MNDLTERLNDPSLRATDADIIDICREAAALISRLTAERDALASVITPGHPDPALMSRIIMKSIENECLAEVAETALENGQAFANQVSHITYLLNGQAYSSTVSALNDFNAHLRRARALEGK